MSFVLLPLLLAVVILVALRRVKHGAEAFPAVAIVAWFAVVFALAKSGLLGKFEDLPPKIPMVALGGVAVGLFVARISAVKEALVAMPPWWPVALQTFRAPLEVGLYLLFAAGLLPEQMTFAGRNFDVLVGLTAPVMAWLIATGRAPRWAQWAWQAAAIGLLINVISIAVTSAPGPLHREWPGLPLTSVAQWPYALLPGFFVPIAVLGHVLSIWKLSSRAT